MAGEATSILNRAVTILTQRMDLILALLIVMIISLIIFPLPTIMLDTLIAVNLAISVMLLILSLYISSALSLSVFPSLLLITTLFRLSLEISATRLILLKADAGDIIYTFGHFVVAGNFVVGVVIFLIIIIVQFIVITKGSERVAEVAARFTLDAMPGKQMSIDADMRAGTIDADTAKKRRRDVEKESQLFGAMDGAMKFVKGDAIAMLITAAINIVGGLVIGVLQKGMPIEKALQVYSILTIGDGLVSQIPSLFISITAGFVVTKVSSDIDDDSLGAEIGRQMLAKPKALLISGGLVLALGLVPGFPKPVFFSLGTIITLIGYALHASPKMRQSLEAKPTVKKKEGVPDDALFALIVPVLIDVNQLLEKDISAELFEQELGKLRKTLYFDLGIPFPSIHLRFNENLPENVYVILLKEVPVARGKIYSDKLLVRDTEDNIKLFGFEYTKDEQFIPNIQTIWVDAALKENLTKAQLPFMTPVDIVIYHLSDILRRHAEEFLGLQETKTLLDNMEARSPEIVKEVLRTLTSQKLTEILKRVVQENVSIRDLSTILQCLIEWGQKEKDPVLLTEYVRGSLKRYISYKYSSGQNMLPVYLLDPTVEDTIRKAIRQTSTGSYIALEPAVNKKLIENIKAQLGDISSQTRIPVLLASMDIRRYLRKLIEMDLYEIPVLSYQELTPEISIQPLGRITL
ncbi:MAG: type III secretion system export apparatus subunit SctV [Nitrospirae bacterium]|nr:type III secretion system export apparatus subunit SctV [Nitrospirota bacterium]